MPKIAKAAAKSRIQNPVKDLFSDLPEATTRRHSGKPARTGRPASGAEVRYTARDPQRGGAQHQERGLCQVDDVGAGAAEQLVDEDGVGVVGEE